MTATIQHGPPSAFRRRARRLRIIGTGILLLGVAVACARYAFAAPPVESDDPATIASDKIDSREIGRIYGNAGVLGRDAWGKLNQPGTQAILIAAAGVVVAGGCLCAAHLLDGHKDRSP